MAKDNKKLVQAITSQEENFAQWYTDICVKAELVEYSTRRIWTPGSRPPAMKTWPCLC